MLHVIGNTYACMLLHQGVSLCNAMAEQKLMESASLDVSGGPLMLSRGRRQQLLSEHPQLLTPCRAKVPAACNRRTSMRKYGDICICNYKLSL